MCSVVLFKYVQPSQSFSRPCSVSILKHSIRIDAMTRMNSPCGYFAKYCSAAASFIASTYIYWFLFCLTQGHCIGAKYCSRCLHCIYIYLLILFCLTEGHTIGAPCENQCYDTNEGSVLSIALKWAPSLHLTDIYWELFCLSQGHCIEAPSENHFHDIKELLVRLACWPVLYSRRPHFIYVYLLISV